MKKIALALFISVSVVSGTVRAMEEEKKTETSYHEANKRFLEWFDSQHPAFKKSTYIMILPRETSETKVKAVVLKRESGNQIEKYLQQVREFNFKYATTRDTPKETKDAVTYARYLQVANNLLPIERQELQSNGDLITYFKEAVDFGKATSLYNQVPGIDDVEKLNDKE